jgi:2'-5' RNA ligase
MHTVELFFDAASESCILTVWDEFARFGSPSMRDSGIRPHITLAACASVDISAAIKLLGRFAGSTASFAVLMPSFGLFPAIESVAYLAPKVTSELLALHAWLFTEFSAIALNCSLLYSPEQWVPHCTLATNLSAQHLSFALDACRSLRLPLVCTVTEIGLIEYWPVKQLYAQPFLKT